MADPLLDVATQMDAQDPDGSFVQVVREQVDISGMHVGPTAVTQDDFLHTANLDNLQLENHNNTVTPAVTTTATIGLTSDVILCSICEVPLHSTIPDLATSTRKIHQLEYFRGMTCFEIFHSPEGKTVWNRHPRGSQKRSTPVFSSAIVMELRVVHGLPPKITRKRKAPVEEL